VGLHLVHTLRKLFRNELLAIHHCFAKLNSGFKRGLL